AEESPDALRPVLGLRDPGQTFLDLLVRADADLVPVEELVFEPREGLIGLLAGRVFVTDPVDDRPEHREPDGVAIGLWLVSSPEQCIDFIKKLSLAFCCHEPNSTLQAGRNGAESNLPMEAVRSGRIASSDRARTGRVGWCRAVS